MTAVSEGHEVAVPASSGPSRRSVGDIPAEAWADWDETHRVSYRDYVRVQREKEAGAHAVREALKRANIFSKLDPGHIASSQLHMGTTCMNALRLSGHVLR